MSGTYNAGSSPARVVLVDPTTLVDYAAGGGGATMQDVVDAIQAQTSLVTSIATDTNELAQDIMSVIALLNDIKTNTTPAG